MKPLQLSEASIFSNQKMNGGVVIIARFVKGFGVNRHYPVRGCAQGNLSKFSAYRHRWNAVYHLNLMVDLGFISAKVSHLVSDIMCAERKIRSRNFKADQIAVGIKLRYALPRRCKQPNGRRINAPEQLSEKLGIPNGPLLRPSECKPRLKV